MKLLNKTKIEIGSLPKSNRLASSLLSQGTSSKSNGQKVLQGGEESSLANHPGTI